MEATADNLLNQISQVLIDKLDTQSFDPKFLQKFFSTLGKKIKFTESSAIPQSQTAPSTASSEKDNTTLTGQIKQAYRDLIKDSTYIAEYKKFAKQVFGKTLTLGPKEEDKEEGRKDLIKDEEKPQEVILVGFTESASRALKGKFSDIFKGLFDKLKFNFESPKGGIGLLGGGLALLLGGLAALVGGLMTDGPFKGLLKILSKAGISGGIKLLEIAAKGFMASLKGVIQAPIVILKNVAKSIGKIFGANVYKALLKPLRGLTGIFTKMLGGLVKLITPLLKRLPLIGSIISFGFAYTRFKSGDVVGGIIDILSGIATMFPGIGTAIGIGLDVLNAFLDVKAGGASPGASEKKTGLLKEWSLGLGKLLYTGIKYIPVVGPLIQAIEDMINGKWLDATYNLVRAIPGVGSLIDIINWFTGGKTEEGIKQGLSNTGKSIQGWLDWLKENIWEKITGFVTNIFDGVKDWWNNLSWSPSTWFGGTPEEIVSKENEASPSSQSKRRKSEPESESKIISKPTEVKNITPEEVVTEPTKIKTESSPDLNSRGFAETETKRRRGKPMAEGGIVTEPIEATVGEAGPEAIIPLKTGGIVTESTVANIGEAGPEAVIPLEKYFNIEGNSLNNSTLESIASNTKDTNSSLKMLGEALLGLVTVLDKKMSNTGNTTVINTPQGAKEIPSAAQVTNSNVDVIRGVRQQFRQMQFA